MDQEIEKLPPPEKQEATEIKLMKAEDTLVDTIDKTSKVTEQACDAIIDPLDALEKWMDKL